MKELTKLLPITFARYLASLTVYVASSQSAPFIMRSLSLDAPGNVKRFAGPNFTAGGRERACDVSRLDGDGAIASNGNNDASITEAICAAVVRCMADFS